MFKSKLIIFVMISMIWSSQSRLLLGDSNQKMNPTQCLSDVMVSMTDLQAAFKTRDFAHIMKAAQDIVSVVKDCFSKTENKLLQGMNQTCQDSLKKSFGDFKTALKNRDVASMKVVAQDLKKTFSDCMPKNININEQCLTDVMAAYKDLQAAFQAKDAASIFKAAKDLVTVSTDCFKHKTENKLLQGMSQACEDDLKKSFADLKVAVANKDVASIMAVVQDLKKTYMDCKPKMFDMFKNVTMNPTQCLSDVMASFTDLQAAFKTRDVEHIMKAFQDIMSVVKDCFSKTDVNELLQGMSPTCQADLQKSFEDLKVAFANKDVASIMAVVQDLKKAYMDCKPKMFDMFKNVTMNPQCLPDVMASFTDLQAAFKTRDVAHIMKAFQDIMSVAKDCFTKTENNELLQGMSPTCQADLQKSFADLKVAFANKDVASIMAVVEDLKKTYMDCKPNQNLLSASGHWDPEIKCWNDFFAATEGMIKAAKELNWKQFWVWSAKLKSNLNSCFKPQPKVLQTRKLAKVYGGSPFSRECFGRLGEAVKAVVTIVKSHNYNALLMAVMELLSVYESCVPHKVTKFQVMKMLSESGACPVTKECVGDVYATVMAGYKFEMNPTDEDSLNALESSVDSS